MKKISINFLFFIFALLFAAASHAAKGKGGASSIQIDRSEDKLILVDLLNHNIDFEDTYNIKPNLVTKLGNEKSPLGYQLVHPESLPVFSLLDDKLNAWQQSSPVLVNKIRSVISEMDFVKFDSYLSANQAENLGVDLLKIYEKFPDARVYRVVTYSNVYGAFISEKTWKKMGDYSRAGTIIHEAFRHIQLFEEDSSLTDEDIVYLTGVIMLGDPSSVSLDKREFLPKSLHRNLNFIQSTNEIVQSLCQATLHEPASAAGKGSLHFSRLIEACNSYVPVSDINHDSVNQTLNFRSKIADALYPFNLMEVKADPSLEIPSLDNPTLENLLNESYGALANMLNTARIVLMQGNQNSMREFMKAGNPFYASILNADDIDAFRSLRREIRKQSRKNKDGTSIEHFMRWHNNQNL